ncbi:MAG: hypothetical protein LBN95_07145 [Prevotellaceae bacterium]|jgi:hypothetical protein|nr:hypothetical protein [Prevotellaceae bacterium]
MRKDIIKLYYPAVLGSYIYVVFQNIFVVIQGCLNGNFENIDVTFLYIAIMLNMTTAYTTIMKQIREEYPRENFISDIIELLLLVSFIGIGKLSNIAYGIGIAFALNQIFWLMIEKNNVAIYRSILFAGMCLGGIFINWEYYKWLFISSMYLTAFWCMYQRWHKKSDKQKISRVVSKQTNNSSSKKHRKSSHKPKLITPKNNKSFFSKK